MQPNKERLQLLVDALYSGEFQQTQGVLKRSKPIPQFETGGPVLPVGYCCLGVACEIMRRETGTGKWTDGIGDIAFITNSGFRSSIFFPDGVGSSTDSSLHKLDLSSDGKKIK